MIIKGNINSFVYFLIAYLYKFNRSCGDVTHFAKDCPEKQKRKREEDLPTVGMMDDRAIEDLDDERTNKRKKQNNTKLLKKKKLVIMK